ALVVAALAVRAALIAALRVAVAALAVVIARGRGGRVRRHVLGRRGGRGRVLLLALVVLVPLLVRVLALVVIRRLGLLGLVWGVRFVVLALTALARLVGLALVVVVGGLVVALILVGGVGRLWRVGVGLILPLAVLVVEERLEGGRLVLVRPDEVRRKERQP